MTPEPAISLRNVSKVYRVWKNPESRLQSGLWRSLGLSHKAEALYRDFHALSGIDLEIPRGQSLGIIGLNGAGKSTLLQIISGTLRPSSGELKIQGRVAPLLELGSGFNPEFTGRENVFLNAAVLGLSREETTRRFADIEAFADIGTYIDQPVKTYSSGMFVRLAFAVLSQIDPEILIIDEALSVGDFLFQQKSYDVIRNFRKKGCTFLFVSHGMGTVLDLCDKAIVLDRGRLIFHGSPKEAVDLYEAHSLRTRYGIVKAPVPPVAATPTPIPKPIPAPAAPAPAPRPPEPVPKPSPQAPVAPLPPVVEEPAITSATVALESVRLLNQAGQEKEIITSGQAVQVQIRFKCQQTVSDPHIGFKIRNKLGQVVYETNTYCLKRFAGPVQPGGTLTATFSLRLPLIEGDYSITAAVASGGKGRGEFEAALHFQHGARHFVVVRDWARPHWAGLVDLEAEAQTTVQSPA